MRKQRGKQGIHEEKWEERNEGGRALQATSNSCQFGCLKLLLQQKVGEGNMSW